LQFNNIYICATCTGYWIQATSTNKTSHHFGHAILYTTTLVYPFLTTSDCIELLPTPLPQTPHGHLAAF